MRIIAIFFLFFLMGCEPEVSDKGPALTPEQVSVGFFNAIYNDKDIKKAQEYVNEPMKEVIAHYHIASAVQRHMLNLSMTDVKLEIAEIDIDFFRKFTDDVTVIVKMHGLKGGSRWIDDRTIRLQKNGGRWEIVEILPEKGNLN
ncbi:nuclear transport factor 2 family protein [Shewanella woodyi]